MSVFNWGLSKKIIVGFVLVVILLMTFTLYVNSNFNWLLVQYDQTLESNKMLNNFFSYVDDARQHLRNYCVNGVQTSEADFWEAYYNAYHLIEELQAFMVDDPYIHRRLTDLKNMLSSYGEEAGHAITLYSDHGLLAAYDRLMVAERINMLIHLRYGAFSQMLTERMELTRQVLLEARNTQNAVNFSIIVGLILLCGAVAGIFIRSIQVEEENKTLRTETLLNQTQLNALQAKINPHFLFNTLNMIQQTAYLEDAQETRAMIESTAQLLRFYLDKSDMNVHLLEELENISEYIYIQEKRIGNRIKFETYIAPDITNLVVPALIIQPILENAILHGLENCIDEGKIEIRVEEKQANVYISVRDNGKGMDSDLIEHILENRLAGATNSIGIQNIVKRLELFFDRKGLISIFSEPGKYTCVEMILPKETSQKRGDNSV